MTKVFIPITNNLAIGSDSAARSWTIVKRKGQSWRDVSWFNTLQQAVNSLSETMLRESGAQSFEELAIAFEEIKQTLSHAIAHYFNIDLGQIGKLHVPDDSELSS